MVAADTLHTFIMQVCPHLLPFVHAPPCRTLVAPEIIKDNKISKAADLYSFGVIMWELYHGITAWQVNHW